MGIQVIHQGKWRKTKLYLTKNSTRSFRKILEKYGQIGVNMLRDATPIDTGATALLWRYQITDEVGFSSLYFCNDNVNKGVPIAIILQYGHGTATGGWVEGRDYINPALKPIFDSIADMIWKEVTSD